MQLTFLSAEYPLVKSFSITNGSLEKSPYPNAYNFTTHTSSITTLKEFHDQLVAHAKLGHCLLKGEIKRELTNEPRAGTTDSESGSAWVCFDLDGLRTIRDTSAFMAAVGLEDVSYVIQHSASSGIGDSSDTLRAHIFVLLSGAVAAPFLKQWLTRLNLETQDLRSELKLTRTGCALSWPLDITCCQNDKLIYIAPPKLAPGVVDNFKGKRIQLVKRTLEFLPTNRIAADVQKNRAEQKAVLAELRTKAGYSKIKDSQYKTKNNISYLATPGDAIITGIKQDRQFTYFNLNGGDSWAYYHPENNPEFIFNFKGEPTYRTEELLPDYWRQLKKIPLANDNNRGREYFAIRDFKTDRFYNGYYDYDADELVIAKAQNENRLRSFLKQHGQPVPDFVPDWELTYNPTSTVRYDPETKVINMYRPSSFYKLKLRPSKAVPKTIKKIIESAVGTGPVFDHFINWTAFIVQKRKLTKTGWVLHGNQGTGKGLLYHKILAPMLGLNNTHSMLMEQLESQFNGWLEQSQLVFVDEVQLSKLAKTSQANAALKSYIVEPMVPIRRMHAEVYNALNYANFIFASNQPDPVTIEVTDRRYNVGMFQTVKLLLTAAEYDAIENELEDFFMFLMALEVDEETAHTVLETDDRSLLISINRTSVDEIADALLDGNLEYLIDQLPHSDDPIFATPAAAAYRALIESLLLTGEEHRNLTRDELFIVFDYCVGNTPRSPNKFTSMLKHHRIYTKKIRRTNSTPYGIQVPWKHDSKWFAAHRAQFCKTSTGTVVQIKKAKVV